MLQKQISAKRAWSDLSDRARLGEKFSFIACLGLLMLSGELTRSEVVDKLNAAGITREDLIQFRQHKAQLS